MSRCADRLALAVLSLVLLACGDEDGPFESPPPRIDTFAVRPLPPVPGEALEISVTGEGLIIGTVRQGEVVVYEFLNGGTTVVGSTVAHSALPPTLVVRGIEGLTVSAEATLLP